MDLEINKFAEELSQSSGILSSIYKLNPDAITLNRASDGKFIDCNQEFLNQTGYSREEVIGSTSIELNLYIPEVYQAYVNAIVKKGLLYNFELKLRRKDGTFSDILYSARLLNFNDEGIILNIGRDISDEKKQNLDEELISSNEWLQNTNEMLRENVELYRQFFNSPLNGFVLCEIITDNEGNPCDFIYLEVNQAFEHFTGLKRKDVLNKRVTEVLPSEEAAEMIEIYGNIVLNNEKAHFEQSRPSLNRYYEIYAFSPKNKQFIALITDITNYKQNEERALKAQKKWEDTFNAVPDLMAIINTDYQVLNVNQAMANRLQVKAEDCIGCKCYELIHGTKKPPLICPHRLMLRDGQEHTVEIHEDKLEGDFINSASPICNQKQELIGGVLVLRDITERKKAEMALQYERDLLQDVMDGAKNSHLVYLDRDFNFVRVNKAYAETCGYKPEEMIGKNHFDLYPHEENEAIFIQVRDTGKPVVYHDKPFEFPEQPERGITYWDWTLTPIKNFKGEVVGLIFSLFETTERKKVEFRIQEMLEKKKQLTEELLVSNEELRNITGELQTSNKELHSTTIELQEANKKLVSSQDSLQEAINKLEISNKELEQFAYIASHDLQEPLRMVSSFTQLLEKRYKGHLDSDADEFISFIVEGAQRMKDLIDDLLAFSRLHNVPREFKLTDLNKALDEVLSSIKPSIEVSNAHITHDNLPTVKCDSSLIRQVFQNLISNGIKFHDSPPQIHVSAEESDNEWLFGVSDKGIGIHSDHKNKIFDIFKRLHSRDEYEGTGIGLSICKRIVEIHGGQIWVESKLDEGSIFYFTIPKNL